MARRAEPGAPRRSKRYPSAMSAPWVCEEIRVPLRAGRRPATKRADVSARSAGELAELTVKVWAPAAARASPAAAARESA